MFWPISKSERRLANDKLQLRLDLVGMLHAVSHYAGGKMITGYEA